MGYGGRSHAARVDQVLNMPLPELNKETEIAKVKEICGSGCFIVSFQNGTEKRVQMIPRLINTVWARRGSFVICKEEAKGVTRIVFILYKKHIKEIKKAGGWPQCFVLDETNKN